MVGRLTLDFQREREREREGGGGGRGREKERECGDIKHSVLVTVLVAT